jgi:hypothetical protein
MLKDHWGAIWGGMKDFFLSIWNKIVEGIATAVNFIVKKLNLLIDGLNAINPFKQIPPIEEMAGALMDLGSAAVDAIDDFIKLGPTIDETMGRSHLEVDKTTKAIDKMGDAIVTAAEKVDDVKTAQGMMGSGNGGRPGGGLSPFAFHEESQKMMAAFAVMQAHAKDPSIDLAAELRELTPVVVQLGDISDTYLGGSAAAQEAIGGEF